MSAHPPGCRSHVLCSSHQATAGPCRPLANGWSLGRWHQDKPHKAHNMRQAHPVRRLQGPSCSHGDRLDGSACRKSQPGSYSSSWSCSRWCSEGSAMYLAAGCGRISSTTYGRAVLHLVCSSSSSGGGGGVNGSHGSSSDGTSRAIPGPQPRDPDDLPQANPSGIVSSSSAPGAGIPEAGDGSSPPRDSSGDGSGGGGGSSAGGKGRGPGSGDSPAAKMPKWFQAWVWVTVAVYLVWRWRWRRERAAERESRWREAAAAEAAAAEWEQFSQRYRGPTRRHDEGD